MLSPSDSDPIDAGDIIGIDALSRRREFTRIEVLRGAFGLTALAIARSASAASPNLDVSDFISGEGMPYDAFDQLPVTDLDVPGGIIHVGFAPGGFVLPKALIFAWIREAASAVSTYYGHFPVASVRFLMAPVDGDRILRGTTWGYRGAAIRILFGRNCGEEALHQDWVMTHEMVHLALPDMSHRYNWLAEGLAVYIEPIARVQAGDLAAKTIWADMKRDMPKGLPQPRDQGLDYDPTWGRIYWGGALFCLMADIGIRRKTEDRLGLQDVMRGVLAAGGNHDAYTDEAGHAFQYEAGHLFRSEVGHRTDLKPATLDEAHAGRMG
jgi:hypothetical protein